MFRSGETTISDAVRKGTAAWAIDEETLITMRARGIKFIGVLVRETQDLFLTQTAHFWDRSKIQVLNYEHRGGALQRYMPFEHFKRRPGRLKKL